MEALGSRVAWAKRAMRSKCTRLQPMLDLMMAGRHRFRKKWRLMVRKSAESGPAQCHRLSRYSRVMLFSPFHSRTFRTNSSHRPRYSPIFCPKVRRCFQMNLNSSFPMFLVTFFVSFCPTGPRCCSRSLTVSFCPHLDPQPSERKDEESPSLHSFDAECGVSNASAETSSFSLKKERYLGRYSEEK